MELTLNPHTDSEISVMCDGQPSHSFNLAMIIPDGNQGPPHPPPDPIAYGKTIYSALFPSGTLAQNTLRSTLTMNPARLLLVSTDDGLDAIPWEYVYGPEGYLILDCHFVRGLPAEQRIPPLTLGNHLNIVAVPANPLSTDVEPLDIEGEWLRLKEIIKDIPSAITLERSYPPTIDRVRRLVAGQQQCVLHFMGHGGQTDTGAILCFEKENGDLDLVTAREFTQRVHNNVFLVTLNACVSATPGETNFSNLAAALVRYRTPYALGMRFSIFDNDARAFSRAFYTDLACGSSVEEALHQARLTLAGSECSWVVGVPVLYTALAEPAAEFPCMEGSPSVKEHRPNVRASILPRAEGAFWGRIDELRRLGDNLTGDNRPRIITIHGGGGQGKTALAREAVERFAFAWPGGVWASSLENLPPVSMFISDLAHFLEVVPQDILDIEVAKHQIFERLAQNRTLIVLDNAETLIEAIEAREPEATHLAQFIMQLPSSSVSLLVTSRIQLGWSGEVSHEIGGLLPYEGAALFWQSAPQRANELDIELAKNLSTMIDGHPFGLQLLGKAFNSSAISFKTFIEEYETRLTRAENEYVDDMHRHHTLYACIETSMHYLNTELLSLLSGLWIFHSAFAPPMAADIFYPNSDNPTETQSIIHDRLYTLWRRGLLTREIIQTPEGVLEFYRLLPVTRLFIEHYLQQAYDREFLLEGFKNIYAGLIKFIARGMDHTSASIIIVQKGREDFERAVEYLSGIERGYYLFYWSQISSRLDSVQYALDLLEQALELAQGQDIHLELLALSHKAYIYMVIDQKQQALALYEQLLTIAHQIGDQEGEANAFHHIATIYLATGQFQQALNYFDEALKIRQEIGNRKGEAASLNGKANVYHHMKYYQEAFALFNQALQLMRELRDKRGEAAVLNSLAYLFQEVGLYAEAARTFEQSIPIEEEIGHLRGKVAGLSGLARLLYYNLNHKSEGIALMKQAIQIMLENDLSNDAGGNTIETLNNILLRMESGTAM